MAQIFDRSSNALARASLVLTGLIVIALGVTLDQLQRYQEAAADFAHAAELAPSDAAAHYRLSRDYDRIGKHEAAQAERARHAQLIRAQEIVR